MHGDVVEAALDFRRSYLWGFRNLAYGDLIGSNVIEKKPVPVPPGLVWGEWLMLFCVCGAL